MDTHKYSLVVKALSFDKRSKTRNKFVDRESFMNLINSPEFQENLRSGILFGELTHKRREEMAYSNIPYVDEVMLSPNLCNVLREVEVKGNDVYMGLDLLDTEAAHRVKNLIKQGVKLSVSISTTATQDAMKFYLKDIKGVDFTLKPDLDASIVAVNFSQSGDDQSDEMISLSSDDDTINIFDANVQNSDQVVSFNEEVNFSLRDYLREMDRPPHLILNRRITEVLRYCRFRKQAMIDQQSKYLRSYIDGYIYQYIIDKLNSTADNENFNLMLDLRLSLYIQDRTPAVRLQQTFKRIKQSIKSTGSIPKELQKRLNTEFQNLMDQLYDYINGKLKRSGKSLK